MRHREKLRMARKMMSKEEVKKHVSPFLSKAWVERRENKATKVRNLIVSIGWAKKDKYEDTKTT